MAPPAHLHLFPCASALLSPRAAGWTCTPRLRLACYLDVGAPPLLHGSALVFLKKERLASMASLGAITGLPGMDPVKIITLIIQAAHAARAFKSNCIRFATYLDTLGGMLNRHQLSDLRKDPDVCKLLEQLDVALLDGYMLVNKCQDCGWAYRIAAGRHVKAKFDEMERDISKYIAMFTLALPSCNGTGRTDQQQKLVLEEQPPHTTAKQEEKRGKQKIGTVVPVPADEGEEQPVHDLAKEEEKRSEQKDESKEQPPSDVAVLKVNMHCVCKGCVERHYNPIVNKATAYTGVEGVGMESDNGIIIVMGRFDAEKLRDHVSKGTKKEVDLVGKNYNIMPIMVGKVVLKFGTAGLRCNCNGCKDIIHDKIYKIKGVKKVRFDEGNNQVTVRGTVDMEELCKIKTEHKG